MSFPTSFKAETWFVRLASGQVKIVAGSALESAFAWGLVDARTPVRATGDAMWSPLGEVAEVGYPETASRPPSRIPLSTSAWPRGELDVRSASASTRGAAAVIVVGLLATALVMSRIWAGAPTMMPATAGDMAGAEMTAPR